MPVTGHIKPTDKAIKTYYAALQSYSELQVTHEGALETAFQRLLNDTAKPHRWNLVLKLSVKSGGRNVIPDGTLRDEFNLRRGYWEAKDTHDDLAVEISKKTAQGYPLTNTIFEDTRRAVLFQNGGESLRVDLTDPQALADLLNAFYGYTEPDIEGFEQAVDEFKERVPELVLALADKIQQAHGDNPKFKAAFDEFYSLCQTALSPNISIAAVDEMLVQHLPTERLIRRIFDNSEFTQRNVVAAEVEKVITALVNKSFNRDDFLKSLDRFYRAIEAATRVLEDFSEKQHFLNAVYERFFQGYSVKTADTHGIVYTPQAIVDFMCASVAEVLETEFGKTLGDKDVHILDPCTGTGNFLVNLLRRVPKKHLPRLYREQLFANEVMLLPYYIAALNIEHAYFELTGDYEAFEGLCFVDTLDLAEARQLAMFTEENTIRVARQKKAPITVIIGNPPYNVGQLNENDNNKNRKYKVIDDRIKLMYAKDSKATLNTKLYDPYLKFFRWAVDRLNGRDGIVCFVTNNSFVVQIAFDGMRKHLMRDFSRIYHLHLEGNVRQNPKLSGTAYSLPYGHVLYCMNNETSSEAGWGRFWIDFIKAKAAEKGVTVWATDMFDDAYQGDQAKHTPIIFEDREHYMFADISQVNSRNFDETHWDRLQWLLQQINKHPRPSNHTKIYGSGYKTFGTGGPEDGIERFWRNILSGSASVQFHRQDSGNGLNDLAKASIQAARLFEERIKF